MGPNKVRSVKRKINAVKGQIAAAVKSANVIFQDALRKVNQAIETIKVKRKELLGYRTTLQLEVGKIDEKIYLLKKDITDIESNYSVIDENITELASAVTKLEEQRDKIQEFIVKV